MTNICSLTCLYICLCIRARFLQIPETHLPTQPRAAAEGARVRLGGCGAGIHKKPNIQRDAYTYIYINISDIYTYDV